MAGIEYTWYNSFIAFHLHQLVLPQELSNSTPLKGVKVRLFKELPKYYIWEYYYIEWERTSVNYEN